MRKSFLATFTDLNASGFVYNGRYIQQAFRAQITASTSMGVRIEKLGTYPEPGLYIGGQHCKAVILGEPKDWGICMSSDFPQGFEVSFVDVENDAEVVVNAVWKTSDGRIRDGIDDSAVYVEQLGPQLYRLWFNGYWNEKRDFKNLIVLVEFREAEP